MRDAPIDAIYFPIDAVLSVIAELSRGLAYEVAAVGRADVIGAELLIGAQIAARSAICQVAGRVAHIDPGNFRDACRKSRAFEAAVQESLRRQWFISEQTVACNFVHSPMERTARWILMTEDYVGRDRFRLRSEYLSIMLGLTKSALRGPMHQLEELGCIRYRDEMLTVVSRETLRDNACECYMVQQIAPFIRPPGSVTTIEHMEEKRAQDE
jgi:CRP-like cAMP-binding protein